jgi:hypothetical protein
VTAPALVIIKLALALALVMALVLEMASSSCLHGPWWLSIRS